MSHALGCVWQEYGAIATPGLRNQDSLKERVVTNHGLG